MTGTSSRRSDEQRARERDLLAILAATSPGEPAHVAARDELVTMNQPLVRHVARRFAGPGEHLDDLVQAANLGLLAAIDAFDLERGTELSTFAAKHMIGEMRAQLSQQAWAVRVPRRLQDRVRAVRQATDELTIEGHRPTVDQVARHLDLTVPEVLDAIEAADARHASSIDAPIDARGSTISDVRGAVDPAITAVEDASAAEALLATLPERERRIVMLRIYEQRTQSEIANEMGMSQVHVSRLLERSLTAMRGAAGER